MMSEVKLSALPSDEYMNADQLVFFQTRLETKATELRTRLGQHRADCEIERHPDEADFASDEEARALVLKMIERDKASLTQVLHALDLIRLGEYGFCHDTGEPIGLQRLLLVPESIYSVESMRVIEARGRHHLLVA